ncbi:myb family transcription factor PHL8-like [Solanum pennellii]|uniref:Myb family transcription factor PHL8-like n=1 Tax=Solanum pennellii TaxID=28526 RepID=A0ABM1VE51_SOLPN|nr:myb family transcription factor PHL8-like [Solanum pennellii]
MTEGSSKKQRCDRVVASHDLNRKPRFRWTVELHEMFVKAVNELGGPYDATPKNIVKLMDDEDITPEHIKSHLQKYRQSKDMISTTRSSSKGKCYATITLYIFGKIN